jgi:hypothetical protein
MTITSDAQCIQLSARETNSQKLATRSHVLWHLLFLPPSPFATPLEIPLADGAICLKGHSQMTCPARETTRRTSWPRWRLLSYILMFSVFLSLFLLELPLAEGDCLRNSQTAPVKRGACGRQHYDNDNSQCMTRDFGWKLPGARRISRE